MERGSQILESIREKVLADAISFVTILDVDKKINLEGDILLYIKTSDLGTVETDKLSKLADKYSSDNVLVTVLVPKTKFLAGKHVENKDSVNIFLQEK